MTSEAPVCIVTGAGGGGCGTAVVELLLLRGWCVVANVHEHRPPHAVPVADAGRLVIVPGDISDPAVCQRLVAVAAESFGRLDAIVHNAAPSDAAATITELDPAIWSRSFRVIVDAVFHLIRAALPALRDGGSVVLVSSNAAARGAPRRHAAYSAAKAALHGLCAHLAVELGPRGVRINAVAPSQVDSPRVRRGGRHTDASLAAVGAAVPLGRVGRPADVAHAIGFLVSPESEYVTGTVIHVDGGSGLTRATVSQGK